ncbi:MAG TPA: NYN domain-containing protein [Thermoanaerobaculia bacterium]|nr:NYN domain-containing protein [Thermoanaerobaculia bacterium]
MCDVESLARALREADLDLEDAPTALGATEGDEGTVRRVYAAGNRFARLRRILEDAGYERVEIDGSPESIRLQLTLDAVDLCHRSPGARFVLAAEPDALEPLLERLASYGREVTLFDPASAPAARPGVRREEPARDDEAPRPRPARRPAPAAAEDLEDGDDFALEELEEVDEEDAFGDDLDEDDEGFDEDEDEDDGAFEVEDFLEEEEEEEDEDEDEGDDEDEDFVVEPKAPRVRRRHGGDSPAAPVRPIGDRAPQPSRDRAASSLRPRNQDDPFDLLLGAIERIMQGPPRLVFESVVRQEILEMEPRFNERAAGFGSFTEFFEEARERGLIELRREPATGTYVVTGARLEPR